MISKEQAVAGREHQEAVPSAADAPVATDDVSRALAGEEQVADGLDDIPSEAAEWFQADRPSERTLCLRPPSWTLVPSSQAVESQVCLGQDCAQCDRVITVSALQAIRLATFGAVCATTGYDLDDSMFDDSCHPIAPGMPCSSTETKLFVDRLGQLKPETGAQKGRFQVSLSAPVSWEPILGTEIGYGS